MFMELKNIFFHFPKQTLLLSGGVETLICGVPAVLSGISRRSDLVRSGHMRPLSQERQAWACGPGRRDVEAVGQVPAARSHAPGKWAEWREV